MKIDIKQHVYFGCPQGYKIWLDGVKYPRKHGHFYTTVTIDRAIECAVLDKLYPGWNDGKCEPDIVKVKECMKSLSYGLYP